MIIYKITNIYNGKIYIGKTIHDLQYRWKQHINKSKKSGRKYLLHNAITKYGAASFAIDIIEICTTNKELYVKDTPHTILMQRNMIVSSPILPK